MEQPTDRPIVVEVTFPIYPLPPDMPMVIIAKPDWHLERN